MPGLEKERICDEPETFLQSGKKEVLEKKKEEEERTRQKAAEPIRAKRV